MASQSQTDSIINLSEQEHKKRLQRRHTRGAIYENLYRLSLVMAVFALLTLLIQISADAFGPVLIVPSNPLSEITETPREELTDEQIATILFEEVGNGMLAIIRADFAAVQDPTFPTLPIAESLRGNTFPDSYADQTGDLTYQDMTNEQRSEFLLENASRNYLLQQLEREVIEPDIIGEWSWIAWVFNRDRVYTEASDELTGDIARTMLRNAEDEELNTTLTAELTPLVGGQENAEAIVSQFDDVQSVLVGTDWDVERRRTQASVEISERRGGGAQTPAEVSNAVERNLRPEIADVITTQTDIGPETADDISERIAGAIVTDDGLDELGSFDQRNILAALMIPDFADTLRADAYELGEVRFISWLDGRFLTEIGSNSVPERVTLRVAVLGSVWVMVITMLSSFPLGVGAAIYLEEYATDNWLNNLIETNIRNLAGVPSIIYGLLGLAVFVRFLEPITSGEVFGTPGTTGRTVLSAGLTLALLILPVIIINAQEAIRAVPRTIREASYGLGATKWQTIWRQILPAAFPGILTGTILAFSRAVGETAPLIVVGAAAAISADPDLFSGFTVIPIQIFNWTSDARPEYKHLAAAAIIVLLGLLIVLNSTAITLRNRFSKKLN